MDTNKEHPVRPHLRALNELRDQLILATSSPSTIQPLDWVTQTQDAIKHVKASLVELERFVREHEEYHHAIAEAKAFRDSTNASYLQ